MPIQIKVGDVGGGSWRPAVTAGNLRFKNGGTTWTYPSALKIKTSDGADESGYGANPRWIDSGYRGYPAPPTGLRVYNWDNTGFSWLQLAWNAPTAPGAPTVSYQVALRDSYGNAIAGVPDYDNVQSPWGNFPVHQDGAYQCYVRSKSAAGLYSPWHGPIKPLMGHTETGYNQNENRTRPWSGATSGQWGKDQVCAVYVPASVNIASFTYDLYTPMSGLISSTSTRWTSHYYANADQGDIMSLSSPVYKSEAVYANGQNAYWGIVVRGTGWSTTGTAFYSMIGNFTVSGTETYQVSVYYKTRDYKANGYW